MREATTFDNLLGIATGVFSVGTAVMCVGQKAELAQDAELLTTPTDEP
jgi:hypothetical protein